MKSSKIALQYGIPPYILDAYLKKQTLVSIKETLMGDILIPDDVDVAALIAPLLAEEQKKSEAYKQKQQEKLQQEAQERAAQQQREDQERIAQMNRERAERERQFQLRIQNLKDHHHNGYYEYKVLSLSDIGGLFRANSGRVDIATMTSVLNDMGLDGWHLVTAYSNELGKNAFSGGAGGVMLGTNSTVDENILIFERFVRFQ